MYVHKLKLQNFRNYSHGLFEFCEGVNLICGPNAKGKTTVLEALHYLMIGRSFRSIQYQDLIKKESQFFYIEGHLIKHGIDQMIRIHADTKERKIIYNSSPITSLSNLLGIVQGVVQTPDDVNLIKGSPAVRREFLDIQIAQTDPLYVHHLTRYTRALKQRNQLLKSKQIATIEPWEHEMSQSASYIVRKRQTTIASLQINCEKYYAALTGETVPIRLDYRTNSLNLKTVEEIKSYYLSHLKKNREKEKIVGFTFIGPHKDDINIYIEDKDIKNFASEGQQRSCATALHFSEWENVQQVSTERPLFMIDDVGMSLDNNRKHRLIQELAKLGQVFLTTTDIHFLDHYSGIKKTFELS